MHNRHPPFPVIKTPINCIFLISISSLRTPVIFPAFEHFDSSSSSLIFKKSPRLRKLQFISSIFLLLTEFKIKRDLIRLIKRNLISSGIKSTTVFSFLYFFLDFKSLLKGIRIDGNFNKCGKISLDKIVGLSYRENLIPFISG